MFEITFSADETIMTRDGVRISEEELKRYAIKYGEPEKGFHKVFIKDDKGVHMVWKYCTVYKINANEFVLYK